MGALNSTLKDDKVDKLVLNFMLRGTKKTKEEKQKKINNLLEKYKNDFNKYGFYTVKLDLKKTNEYFKNKSTKFYETFENLVIENFSNKQNGTINPILVMMGSLYGFYTINENSNKKLNSNSEIKLLVSKTLLLKDQYSKTIKFIFDEWVPIMFPQNEKQQKETQKLKKMILKVFEKINSKKHPETAFSNILGLIIKVSVMISIHKLVEDKKYLIKSKRKKNPKYDIKQKELINMVVEEIINLIPDDRCNFLNSDVDFIKIDPELCKFDTRSYCEKDLEKSNIEKINLKKKTTECQKNFEETSDNLEKTKTKLKNSEKSKNLWRIIGIVGIILFLLFLILYITKKGSSPDKDIEFEGEGEGDVEI